MTVAGRPFTVCRVDLKSEQLHLFWRDDAGKPYRQFSALRDALESKAQHLVFAVNAGMYKPDFSPVGLFVVGGQELKPLNRHVGSGNFSQQPNGVFLVEGASARIITTDDYDKERPKPLLATQSGPMLVHEGEITTSEVMSPTSTWRKIRNGVCAPSPDAAVFVISESPVTFYEFASFFRDSLHQNNFRQQMGCQKSCPELSGRLRTTAFIFLSVLRRDLFNQEPDVLGGERLPVVLKR